MVELNVSVAANKLFTFNCDMQKHSFVLLTHEHIWTLVNPGSLAKIHVYCGAY